MLKALKIRLYPNNEQTKQIGVNPSNIINCCNGKQKTCKRMKFFYIEKGLASEAPKGMYKENSK